MNKELKLTGLLTVNLSIMYNRLMTSRDAADYSNEVELTKDIAEYYLHGVDLFNRRIYEILLLEGFEN
jgi:uncharacterized protein (UPF0332 family)